MNSPIHFFTGYLSGRALGYREHRFETLYVAVAAYAPDLDSPLSGIFPFLAHGIWTHTLAGVAMMSVILSSLTFGVFAWLGTKGAPGFLRLVGLAFLGGVTHLVLDAFTYYETAADASHHMYCWPFWNFPWHFNTLVPGVTYAVRVWVEVLYSMLVASIILGYQWFYRGQNPFRMFNPRNWFRACP